MTQKKRSTHHYHHLKTKWTAKHVQLHQSLWEKHKDSLEWLKESSKQITLGSLAGLIMFTHPVNTAVLAQNFLPKDNSLQETVIDAKTKLLAELGPFLPQTVEPLTHDQEETIANIFTKHFQMPVSAELQGKRLNRSYGLIGAEQHLMRYPGDTMDTHFDTPEEYKFTSSSMAPGRGAWGYFTNSQGEMTEQDVQREKYYIAVQTFLAPGYMENVNEYYNFFKYRKMLVVNAENGKAIVVVIGDAGPGKSTGKHLGGSPEVMNYLERQDGRAKGPVLYFFIDDPEDKIPLGPIEIK